MKDHGNKVFQLLSIDDTHFHMVHHGILETPLQIEVAFEDGKKWKVTKAKMPVLCGAAYTKNALPQAHPMVLVEWQRLQLSQALHKAHQTCALSEKQIAFAINPSGLYTLQPFKKNQLKLVPLGHVAHWQSPKDPIVAIHHFGKTWSITPWKQDSLFDNDASPLIPWCWVKKAGKEQVATVEWSQLTSEGIKIPVLTNGAPLEKGVLLLQEDQTAAKDQPAAKEEEESQPAPKKKKKS